MATAGLLQPIDQVQGPVDTSGGTSNPNYNIDWNSIDQSFRQASPGWNWQPQQANFDRLHQYASNNVQQFASQFQNLVGRAPTQDEVNQFVTQYITPNAYNIQDTGTPQYQNPASYIQQYVANNSQQAAQQYATQQLAGQTSQANSLADLFRTQGNAAISSTESSLLDYQSQLFNRLRPNLLTSLKAQGLLDTGGMNEAIAGVQGDLANQASNYIAQLKYQNEQGANQIAFGGASAPYYYQQGAITQNPNTLLQQGIGATGQNNNTFMANLAYNNQLGLIKAQAQAEQGLQPSFMRTFGQSFGQSLGQGLGQWASPGAAQSSAGGTSAWKAALG